MVRMEQSVFYEKLCQILSKDQILCNEPMSRHTTFRVGGQADFYLTPRTEQVAHILALCKKEQVPCQIVGNGSNLLVGDLGIRGVVLAFAKQAGAVRTEGNCVKAQAGALLSKAAGAAWKGGLGGLEFAAGIPGSVGGAVVMNAGAYGGECKDVLRQVTALTQDGELVTLSNEELDLSYRHSCIPARGLTVLEAEFALQQKPQEEILALMDDLKSRRIEKQPLEYPSAGSTFKRPQGNFAGKLIMDAGLKGVSVGGAMVSEKHCGFVINTGGATAADVLALIHKVQEQVFAHSGVRLETEVRCMGEFA